MKKKKLNIYLDGLPLEDIKKYKKKVDGFTFNPSLFKSLGVKNYLDFTKKVAKAAYPKSVSIEVIGDDENTIFFQAKKLAKIYDNIFVKIPITYTNGKSTFRLIKKLNDENIKLNITSIFTLKQIKKIFPIVRNEKHILSVFSGRIFDIGIDAEKKFREISKFLKSKNSKCKLLWASSRMVYDVFFAQKSNADIITIPLSIFKKQKLFKMKPEKYSLETVKTFYNDAVKAKFKI